MRTGILISGTILTAALAVAFWPVLQMPRFWVSLGIIAGMVGLLVFSIAEAQKRK